MSCQVPVARGSPIEGGACFCAAGSSGGGTFCAAGGTAGGGTFPLKAFLEPKGLYNYDGRATIDAAWHVAKTCHYIDDYNGAQYYHSFSGLKAEKEAKRD